MATPCVGMGSAAAGPQARGDFSKLSRYLFVPSRTAALVTVIDVAQQAVVGSLEPDLVPRQIVVSKDAIKLAAIDERTPQISIMDLADGGRLGAVALDFVPNRLLGSLDGYIIAAVDLAGGRIALVELQRERIVSSAADLSQIHDLLFGADGAFLYVTADGLDGVGVIDVARGKLIEQIATPGVQPGTAGGLTRSPNGRFGYVKSRDGDALSVIDLANFRPLQKLSVGRGSDKVFPTGYGEYLIVPDNKERSLLILAASSLTTAATLKAGTGMTTVYSGWFDTIALVPSATERKLLVYDLDRLAPAGELALPAAPGPGGVTPDGATLFLTLDGMDRLAVIDLQRLALAKMIEVGRDPAAAVLARSYDICH